MGEKASILNVKHMTIRFEGQERPVVDDVDFRVGHGEIVLIVGENGAGKSSIFRSLVRENDIFNFARMFRRRFADNGKRKEIDERQMFYLGNAVDSDAALDRFRRAIGYAPQEDDADSFLQRRVRDYILDRAMSSSEWRGGDKVDELVAGVYRALHCELYDKVGKKTNEYWMRRLPVCSGGEKRMATLLSALARVRSKLFVLDEPINNLDGTHAKYLNNYLISITKNTSIPEEERPGVLIITHCKMFGKVDRVYTLQNGKLQEEREGTYCPQNCFGVCDEVSGIYKM